MAGDVEWSHWNGQYWFSPRFLGSHLSFSAFHLSVLLLPVVRTCGLSQRTVLGLLEVLLPTWKEVHRNIWEIYSLHSHTPWGQSLLNNWQRGVWKASSLASTQENTGVQLTLKSFPWNSGDQVKPTFYWTLPEITPILGFSSVLSWFSYHPLICLSCSLVLSKLLAHRVCLSEI